MPSFSTVFFKRSSHQSIADPGIAPAMWGSPLDWVFSFVYLQICAPSDLFCSLGGILCGSHISSSLALWLPLDLANERGIGRRSEGERSEHFWKWISSHSRLLPLSLRAQLCSACNPPHHCTTPVWWDRRAIAHTNFWQPLPALLQTTQGVAPLPAGASPYHFRLAVDLTLPTLFFFFFKYPL